ncbi:MAG: transposase, partial [Candidatus Omnitrophica bacterium]|nr:transposase [Candidatus Omnitrophota bacterium]
MPRFNLAKKRGKAKVKISDKRRAAMNKVVAAHSEEFDVKLSVIQELIPLGLKAVAEELQNEVKQLAGARYSRGTDISRWGTQNGSVYLREEKIPIKVPRVRDVSKKEEVQLKSYQRLQSPFKDDENILRRLLHGLSTHKYHESSSLAAESFGISASNLSKRFKRNSTQKLKELQNRSLSKEDIVAIFVDGKRYAKDGIMVALGVTLEGRKIVLGIEQVHGENSNAIGQWFDRLIERGLKFEKGILFIIDGAKGIRKAVKQKFGHYSKVQRCRWHKRENVLSYLNNTDKAIFRRRLQDAYNKTTHREAMTALEKVHQELAEINISAANSLLEGLDETLTIHELGLSVELARSLSTTNCIEGFMSQLGSYTDKVDRWQNSSQIQRWVATAAMDIEPRLRRIKGYKILKVLRFKLEKIVESRIGKKN